MSTTKSQEEQLAREEIRECIITLEDPWRCDFCEPNCNCDEIRKKNTLECIMLLLDMNYEEADKFYDENK